MVQNRSSSDSATSISVIIPCWHSGAYLPRCLDSLWAQTFSHFEVILMDNGDVDGVTESLAKRWPGPNLRVERLERNYGFAVASNLGARLARGRWLALLNADAFPEPDWLAQLLQAAEDHPEFTFFSSRQIQANDTARLDGEGDAYHISGMAWRRNYNLAVGEAGPPQEVFSPCAAAALYPREMFLLAGGFDEDYFSYFEDVDLGFRLRLMGARCLYVPKAAVHHVGFGSTRAMSDFAVYHGHRNLIWTFLKDMPIPLLWLVLPLHILTVVSFAFAYTRRGHGRAAGHAIWDALAGIPKTLRKRRTVQKTAAAGWQEVYAVMSKSLLEPYREIVRRKRRA